MDTRPIGVFDSGLGGLTAVRELRELLPAEDFVYFGDTARVPYGSRGNAVIAAYARQGMRFLERQGVKLIIVACGTVSSVLGTALGDGLSTPCLGVVEPTARAARAATKSGAVGVIATAATVRSGSYEKALRALDPALRVQSAACPLFVPLVENGHTERDDPVTQLVARQYLAAFDGTGADTLILGCTHYPLIAPLLEDVTGGALRLIDAGRETVRAAAEILQREERLSPVRKIGSGRFFVTDRTDGFAGIAARFLGTPLLDEVTHVDVDTLP